MDHQNSIDTPQTRSDASNRSPPPTPTTPNGKSFDTNELIVHGQQEHQCYNDGAPQIGRNFYINRDQIHKHKWMISPNSSSSSTSSYHAAAVGAGNSNNDDGTSFSSLSAGGVESTISKVVGNHCGGLSMSDIENAGGDEHFDDTTTICPDKDEFDYAYAYNTISSRQGCSSHHHLQPPVTHLMASGTFNNRHVGGEGGSSVGGASEGQQSISTKESEGHSSLSSLTNDFAVGRIHKKQLVPKFDENGRFATFGRKVGKKESKITTSSSKKRNSSKLSQLELNASPSFDKDFEISVKTPPKMKRIGSSTEVLSQPWYSANQMHQPKHHHQHHQHEHKMKLQGASSPARSRDTATHSNSTDPSLTTPPSSPIRVNRLGKEFIMSQEHVDTLVRFPNSPELLVEGGAVDASNTTKQQHRRNSDMDSHLYTNDTSMRSMGFGSYVAGKFNESSKRKKTLVLIVVVMLLVCIAAIMVAAFGANNNNDDGSGKVSNVDNVEEEDGWFIGKTDLNIRDFDSMSEDGMEDSADIDKVEDGETHDEDAAHDIDSDIDGDESKDEDTHLPGLATDNDIDDNPVTSSPSRPPSEDSSLHFETDHDQVEGLPTPSPQHDEREDNQPTPGLGNGSDNQLPASIEENVFEMPTEETVISTSSIHDKESVEVTTKMPPITSLPMTSKPTPSPTASPEVPPSNPYEDFDLSSWEEVMGKQPTSKPTQQQRPVTRQPTRQPSKQPTKPTRQPTRRPVTPTRIPTQRPSSKPTKRPSAIINQNSDSIIITSSDDTSVFRNRPTKTFDTHSYLTVKGSDRGSSYIRFDISSLSRNRAKPPRISQAVLRLYSINGDEGGLSSVSVDMLPFAGRWIGGAVTYNNPVQSTNSFEVGSFVPNRYETTLEMDGPPVVHEVDVTRAFRKSPASNLVGTFNAITFKLYSTAQTVGRVDFASSEFNGGDVEPELILVLADDDDVLTPYPSAIPSKKPTKQPVVTPELTDVPTTYMPTEAPITPEPSKKPTRKPTKKPVTPKPTKFPVTIAPTTPSPVIPPSLAPVTAEPSPKPVTDSPTPSPVRVTTAPTKRPTPSPIVVTTTTSSTTTTRFFDDCPSEYESTSGSSYSSGLYASIFVSSSAFDPNTPRPKYVYQCTSASCNSGNPIYAPGGTYETLGGWKLVGNCVETVTVTTTTSVATAIPTTLSPTSRPSAKPSLPPTTSSPTTSSPTTLSPTTSSPSEKPSAQPTKASTPPPTFSPITQEPTPQPTPNPTKLPTEQPVTPNPTTSAPATSEPSPNPTDRPTPLPTPNPTNPDPSPEPTNQTPQPTDEKDETV